MEALFRKERVPAFENSMIAETSSVQKRNESKLTSSSYFALIDFFLTTVENVLKPSKSTARYGSGAEPA